MHALTNIAASVLPIWQERHQHEEGIHVANQLHQQVLDLNDALQKSEMQLNQELFEKDCALERELHYGQMSHDFDIARREGIRDAWSQKSQLLQTLMVVDTLMFSCAYALLIQGNPPADSSLWLVRAYAAALGLSMSLLFASVWCSLKLQARLSHYNMHRQDVLYACGRQHRHFGEYFICHCRSISSAAFILFYLGTSTTVIAAALYAFSKTYYQFSNVAAGVLFVCFAAVAVALPSLSGVVDLLRPFQNVDDSPELAEAVGAAAHEAIVADIEVSDGESGSDSASVDSAAQPADS